MKYLIILSTVLLASCSTPVTIVDFTKSVVKNYSTYHECAAKYDGWIEWYQIQKKLWNESN